MKSKQSTLLASSLASSVVLGLAAFSPAALLVTEVNPEGSGSTYATDWFEVTNTGPGGVDLTGYKVDDSSHAFASAVPIDASSLPSSTIAAGKSVVFIESSAATAAATIAAFNTFWFGATVPAGFSIVTYSGSGIGLSTGGDEVNIYDSAGTLITGVSFGATTTGKTFDNAAGIGGATVFPTPSPAISTASVSGVNGAFASVGQAVLPTPATGTLQSEIGSPGAVPEPTSLGLLSLGGALLVRRRRSV